MKQETYMEQEMTPKQSQVTTPLSSRRGAGGEASPLYSGTGSEAVESEAFSDEALISDVFARRELLADLDKMIIADVRHQARRAWLRRWVRVALFSFGLPLVLIVFFACAYLYIKEFGRTPMSYFVMLWPTIGLLFSTGYAFRTFSPDEV